MRLLDTSIQYLTPPLLLLAEITPMPGDQNFWLEVVKQLGVLAVLVWYLYYNTARALPRLQESAAKDREALALLHKQEMDQKRTDYMEQMKDQREMFLQSLNAQTDAFKSAIDKVTCKFETHELPCSRRQST